jgi:hypothetical protein
MLRSLQCVIITKAGVVAFALFVCGCATQAQRQFQAMTTNDKAASEKVAACAAAAYNSPEAAVLRPHAPLKPFDATLQQMSDPSVISDQEIDALFVTHARVQECRKAYLADISLSTPSIVPIYTAFYNRGDDDLLALIRKQLTWGEFTKRRRDDATETQAAVQADARRIVEGLKQDNAAELAQRQRAAEAMAQWAQTQQMINVLNRPTFYAMPSITSPNSFNCLSNRVGNTVSTNCN